MISRHSTEDRAETERRPRVRRAIKKRGILPSFGDIVLPIVSVAAVGLLILAGRQFFINGIKSSPDMTSTRAYADSPALIAEREKAKEVLAVFNRLANEYTENLKTTLNQPRTESSRNAREANSQLESKEKCLSALTKKLDSGRRKQLAKDALLDSLERNKNDVIETFRKDFEHYCECHIFCNVAGEWSEKKSKMQGEYYDLRNKYDLIRYGGDYIFQGETFYGFKDVYKDFFISILHNNFSLENCTSNEIFLRLKEIIAKTLMKICLMPMNCFMPLKKK